MDVTDIQGARPKNLFRSRGDRLGNAGKDIINIEPAHMRVAGTKKLTLEEEGVAHCVVMPDTRYNSILKKEDFNSLTTKDINGDRKYQILIPDYYSQDLKAAIRKKDPNVPDSGDNL